MANRIKVLRNVAFQRINSAVPAEGFAVITSALQKAAKTLYSRMRPLAFSACIRVIDKPGFKKRLKYAENRMVHDTVPKWRRTNMPLFCIVNNKRAIGAMLICPSFKGTLDAPQLRFNIGAKAKDFFAVALPGACTAIRALQIFKRTYLIEKRLGRVHIMQREALSSPRVAFRPPVGQKRGRLRSFLHQGCFFFIQLSAAKGAKSPPQEARPYSEEGWAPGVCRLTPVFRRKTKSRPDSISMPTTEERAPEPNVGVRIRRCIVEVHRENASLGAIVPVAAAVHSARFMGATLYGALYHCRPGTEKSARWKTSFNSPPPKPFAPSAKQFADFKQLPGSIFILLDGNEFVILARSDQNLDGFVPYKTFFYQFFFVAPCHVRTDDCFQEFHHFRFKLDAEGILMRFCEFLHNLLYPK